MAKHLSPEAEKIRKKETVKLFNLPTLIKHKPRAKRNYEYTREFSLAEIVPVLAALVLLFAACFAPVAPLIKLIAYAVSAFVAGFSILRRCLISLLHSRLPDEDGLLLLSSFLTFLAGKPASGVILLVLGRVIEFAEAYIQARSSLGIQALRELLPEKAHIKEDFGTLNVVPEEIREGDTLTVFTGEMIPVDGEIMDGPAEVVYSVYGESDTPILLNPGDRVLAGGINHGDSLQIRAIHSFETSTFTKHLQALSETENERTWIETRVTHYASIFTRIIIAFAVLAGLVAPFFHGDWSKAFEQAAIILFLASPSTLLISIPVIFLGGMTSACRNGIRIKGKRFLELLSQAKTIAFGKTGTITDGDFSILEIATNRVAEAELLRVAAAAESFSHHPVAETIKTAAGWTAEQAASVLEVNDIPGRGVTAFFEGKHVYVGNAALLEEHGIRFQIPSRSGVAIHVAVENAYWGYILLNDRIREGAFDAIEELRGLGMRSIVLLTGDVRSTTSKVARSLNFDMVKTELTPDEKVSAIEFLKSSLGKFDTLVYVGDGFHDADMFENADVGLALNAMGDDQAEEAADVILMNEDILRVPVVLKFATGLRRILIENIALVCGVKAVSLLLGLVGILSVFPAAILNAVVLVLACLNSLRSFSDR